jgi:serine/threonine protein kinase
VPFSSGPDLAGRTLAGRYEILRRLRDESVGAVWAARDRESGALVEVKVVSALTEAGDDPRFVRFAREMKASFLVTHRNTVEVVDFGEEPGPTGARLRYLVLEWLVAHPLSAELEKGPLPWARTPAIVVQTAQALGAAHQEGIVHRALSPERVLVLDNADGDFVKVADFGLAKLEVEGEAQVTAAGARLGDLRYAAPEYVRTGEFTARSDLYALGVLWFHLLVGRPPFEGAMEELFDQHQHASPPRVRSSRPEVPAWIDELVASLLEKKPSDRPSVYKLVQRIEDELGGPVRVPEPWPLDRDGVPIRPAPPPPVPPSRMNALAVVGLAAGGLLALAGLVGVGLGSVAVLWVLVR